jgi:hypothetical protein
MISCLSAHSSANACFPSYRDATGNSHNCRAAILSFFSAGEVSTMSSFDWKSPEAYANMQGAEAVDFAWEYLRRNGDYRRDYASLERGDLSAGLGQQFRERWGLSFRG